MSIKTLEEVQDEFCENDSLSGASIKDLKWHLEHNPDPHMAIILATDAGLISLAPLIAKHLESEDGFIRERTVGCLLGRLFQAQYAAKGLQMAKEDPRGGARDLAVSSLGAVIDNVDKKLQQEIADYIYQVLTSPDYDKLYKKAAYRSVIDAMETPLEKRPRIDKNFKLEELIDKELLTKFCKKYNVKMKS